MSVWVDERMAYSSPRTQNGPRTPRFGVWGPQSFFILLGRLGSRAPATGAGSTHRPWAGAPGPASQTLLS